MILDFIQKSPAEIRHGLGIDTAREHIQSHRPDFAILIIQEATIERCFFIRRRFCALAKDFLQSFSERLFIIKLLGRLRGFRRGLCGCWQRGLHRWNLDGSGT